MTTKKHIFLLFLLLLTVKIQAQDNLLQSITTLNHEYGIAFITENMACFTRNDGDKKLMLISRNNGIWGTPTVAPFSGEWQDEYPTFDPKRKRLYFASNRPVSSNGFAQQKNDIWYVSYENESFTSPIHLKNQFSTKGIDSGAFGDGDWVYFHSDRSGAGFNDVDIYKGNVQSGAIEKLDISSPVVDGEPHIFGNPKTMIFMSSGYGAGDNSDIFITQLNNGSWSTPISVDDEGLVNTSAWEYSPGMSPDGQTLYFTRGVEGQVNIYGVEVKDLSSAAIFQSAVKHNSDKTTTASSQAIFEKDSIHIHRACTNYIEGFYEGDEQKLRQCLDERLYKYGYWKSKGNYSGSQMTFEQALKFANDVKRDKKFASENAIRKIEILDQLSHIGCAKITAWWGVDYALLSKKEDRWIIEQILWQGPLKEIGEN
ncbi:MAG: nuclear transport factor 2 family protein [Bacteroidota bacterium]